MEDCPGVAVDAPWVPVPAAGGGLAFDVAAGAAVVVDCGVAVGTASGTGVDAGVGIAGSVGTSTGTGVSGGVAAAGTVAVASASCAAGPPTPMAMADSSMDQRAVSGDWVGALVTGMVAVGAMRTGSLAARGIWISSRPAPSAAAVARRTVKAATRMSNRQGERR